MINGMYPLLAMPIEQAIGPLRFLNAGMTLPPRNFHSHHALRDGSRLRLCENSIVCGQVDNSTSQIAPGSTITLPGMVFLLLET